MATIVFRFKTVLSTLIRKPSVTEFNLLVSSVTADPVLVDLFNELSSYPVPSQNNNSATFETGFAGVAIPFQLATEAGVLSFLSTTTVFGTPVDITLSELAMESFFPADTVTFDILNQFFKPISS